MRMKRGEFWIMKDRVAIVLSIAALVAGIAIFADAQNRQQGAGAAQQNERQLPPPPPPPPFALPRVEHLARELNLSDAQVAQVRSILDASRPVVDALMHKLD